MPPADAPLRRRGAPIGVKLQRPGIGFAFYGRCGEFLAESSKGNGNGTYGSTDGCVARNGRLALNLVYWRKPDELDFTSAGEPVYNELTGSAEKVGIPDHPASEMMNFDPHAAWPP